MRNSDQEAKALAAMANGSKALHDRIQSNLHTALRNAANSASVRRDATLMSVIGPKAEVVMDAAVTVYTVFYAPYTFIDLQSQIDAMGDRRDFSFIIYETGGRHPEMGEPVARPRTFAQSFIVELIREASKKEDGEGGYVMVSKAMVERSLQFLDAVGLIGRSDRRGGQGFDVIAKPEFKALVETAIIKAIDDKPTPRMFPFNGIQAAFAILLVCASLDGILPSSANTYTYMNTQQIELASVSDTASGLKRLLGGGPKPNARA